MFYVQTPNLIWPPEPSQPNYTGTLVAARDVHIQHVDTGWLAIATNSGGWAILDDREYAAFRTIQQSGVIHLPTDDSPETWRHFVRNLANRGLVVDSQDQRDFDAPSLPLSDLFSLTLLLSERCNLACTYCYLGMQPHRQGQHIQANIARFAIAETFMRPETTLLIDFGEITVCYDLFCQLVMFTEQLHSRFPEKILRLAIQTNGTSLAPEVLDFIQEHSITVGVSLDGPSDMHDQVRPMISGRSSHWRVEQGVREIVRRGIPHIILCTISRANVARASKLLDYLQDLGVFHFAFKPVIRRGSARVSWEMVGVDVGQFCTFLDQVVAYAMANQRWDALDYWLITSIFRTLKDKRGWSSRCPSTECGCGFHMLVLSPRGDYYPCPRFVSFDEHELRLGRSQVEAFGNVQTLFAEYKAIPSHCGTCLWRAFCRGGCSLAHYGYTNAIAAHNSNCSIYNHIYQLIFSQVLPRLSESTFVGTKLGKLEVVNQPSFAPIVPTGVSI